MTTATNLGFLINLCVLLTPLFLYLAYGEKISRLTLISCLSCFFGAVMLTGFNVQVPNAGDLLCLAGAMSYAVWIIALDRTLKVVDAPILITTLQFVPATLMAVFLVGSAETAFDVDYAKIWPALLFISVLSTCISFLIASYAQRLVKPVIAGLIYSFEAVFGAIAAYFALGEKMSLIAMIGSALMFASVLFCQYRASIAHAKTPESLPQDRTFRRSV